MFRIADGEELGYDDPPLRGHSIEFRINAEDPGRGFLPAPGTITTWRPPSGPGVRLDAGYGAGMTVPQAFDSLIAKLIVTGADRAQCLERSRRALAEFEIGGMPTVLPFHRAVLDDPAFTATPFSVHTGWIETGFSADLPPYSGDTVSSGGLAERERITVEVGGKRLEVVIPAGLGGPGGGGSAGGRGGPAGGGRPPSSRPRRDSARAGSAGGGSAGGGAAGRAGIPLGVAPRAAAAAARRAATPWSARCRGRSSRSSPRTGSRCRPVTRSWCSRP
jgi:acetyl-CoA/propionyl-CoA carboxylase, biotin carboxylase, biotin carboxyl carrier protein